jgi:hypothetical protein
MQSCTLILPLIDNITTIVKLYLVALYITLRDGEREAIAQNGLRRSIERNNCLKKRLVEVRWVIQPLLPVTYS